MPSYEHARFLPALFESVLAQTWPNLELVVIDDGSRDASAQVAERFSKQLEEKLARFSFRTRENRGVSATLNELFGEARGEFICLCASDDRILPTGLERLAEVLSAAPEVAMACADARFIGVEGEQVYLRADGAVAREKALDTFETALSYFLQGRPQLLHNGEFGAHHTLLAGNYIPMGSLLRARIARRALPYPSGLMLDDLHFWLQLSRHGRFLVVPEVLMEYRQHPTNTSRTRGERLRADRFKLLLGERDYAASTGHLDDWQRAMESALSLRGLSELRQARAAGFDTLGFLRRRAAAHLRRVFR